MEAFTSLGRLCNWFEPRAEFSQGQDLPLGFVAWKIRVLSLKQQKQQNMKELSGTENNWAVQFSEMTCVQ